MTTGRGDAGGADALLNECPVHLERCCGELIRRVTETQQYVLNGYPAGEGVSRMFYECADCGRRLKVLE